MSKLQIKKRKDVNPKSGKKKYGNVKFADSVNNKYALGNEEQVRAAWSYINMPRNAAKYSSSDLATIKRKIKSAGKKYGIEFQEQNILASPKFDLEQTINTAFTDKLQDLMQDHYHIEGSLEDHCCHINDEFKEWNEDSGLGYAYIMGILTDSVIICCSAYDSGTKYFKIPYVVDADDDVEFGTPTPVDVNLVVDTLGMGSDNEGEGMMEQDEKTEDESLEQTIVETVKPVVHSDELPTVSKEEDDANKGGPGISTSEIESETSPVEHSDTLGVTVGSDAGTDYKPETVKPAGKITEDKPDQYNHGINQSMELRGSAFDSGNKSLSYITQSKVVEKEGIKTIKIQGIATRGDIINSENQVYPLKVWEKNLPEMNKLAQSGKFLGNLEHPDSAQPKLVDTAIKYEKFWIQGNDIHFEGTVIPTKNGEELGALIQSGVGIDLSSRGYGSVKQGEWRGGKYDIIQEDFTCTAFDAVLHAASMGSGIKSYQLQAKDDNKDKGEKVEELTQAQQRAKELRAKQELTQTRSALLEDAKEVLSAIGLKAYKTALDQANDLESLIQSSDSFLPIVTATFGKDEKEVTDESTTYSPTFFVKQSADETAPQTVDELLDRLVADLPDTYPGNSKSDPRIPNKFQSPKVACKFLMKTIAESTQGTFHGPSAIRGLLALEQGKIAKAENILTQSLATGSTIANANADNDGAPLSAPLIFPLIRRIFPRLIMGDLASIQPMDRPEGKIFFLDQFRTEDPAGFEKRIDLNTSANPFNSSYADNNIEGSTAELIRLRLTSITVSAETKKLGAQWSIEEMQDLRAYHGLDAAQELMGGVAKEIALEWNKTVLDDMLTQALAGNLTYGTTSPSSGFPNQVDWDAYLWNYVQKLDNLIFSQRNGPMTHLVCGMDAALALSKSVRFTANIGGDNGGEMDQQYPGTVYFGSIATPTGSRYKIFKTNFWGTGTSQGSKILGLRKGEDWSDTAYIWAPYTDYVTPLLTDPADFSQKQGIVSRAAKKVVVPQAMGTITVNTSTGATV